MLLHSEGKALYTAHKSTFSPFPKRSSGWRKGGGGRNNQIKQKNPLKSWDDEYDSPGPSSPAVTCIASQALYGSVRCSQDESGGM